MGAWKWMFGHQDYDFLLSVWTIFPQMAFVLHSRGKLLFFFLFLLRSLVRFAKNRGWSLRRLNKNSLTTNCLDREEKKETVQLTCRRSASPFLMEVKLFSIFGSRLISLLLVALYLWWKVAEEWETVHRKCLSSWWCCKLKAKMSNRRKKISPSKRSLQCRFGCIVHNTHCACLFF